MTLAAPGSDVPSGPVPLYDGAILLSFSQTKQGLDRLKRLCVGRDLPDVAACSRFDKATKQGEKAEPLYLAKYIERLGTGTGDMIARCQEAGLPEPQFALTDGFVVTLGRRPQRALEAVAASGDADGGTKPALSRHQVEIIRKCVTEQPITALMAVARRTDRTKFRTQVMTPLLAAGLLAMTIPDKPRSSNQKYRLTEEGRALLATFPTPGGS